MKHSLIAIVASFFFFTNPFAASAAIGDAAIKTWNTPAPNAIYGFTEHVMHAGTVEIPADWMGQIRLFRDGVRLSEFDQVFFNYNAPTTTFPFNVDTDVWAQGAHQVAVRFDGAAECRLVCANNDLTCQNAVNSDSDPDNDWCAGSVNNQVLDQPYPARNISVGPPPQPALTLSVNPIHFWNHIPGSGAVTEVITLTNTGAAGTVASGNAAHISGNMFSCVSGCTYAITAGETHQMTIRFTPPATENSWYGVFQLYCSGCLSSSVVLNVDGVTATVAGNAEIRLYEETFDFGSVNVGSYRELDLWITNEGETPMTGTVTFNNPQLSCRGNCNFSVDPGQDRMKVIIFTPTVAGALVGVEGTVSASTGGASPVTFSILGEGNDTPQLGVWSNYTGYNAEDGEEINITNINAGETSDIYFAIFNRGAGILDVDIDPIPVGDGTFSCSFGCATAQNDNLRNYDAYGDQGDVTIRIAAPVDGSSRSVVLTFRSVTPGVTDVIRVTLNLVPNTAPLARTDGCYLSFGNVLVGESSLPRSEFYWGMTECWVENAGFGALPVNLPSFIRNGTGRYDCVTGPGYSCGALSLSAGERANFTYRFTALTGETETSVHNWSPVAEGVPFQGFSEGDIHFHAQPMSIDLRVASSSSDNFGATNINSTSTSKQYEMSVRRVGGYSNEDFSTPLPGRINYQVVDSLHFKCISSCTGTVNTEINPTRRSARIAFVPGTDVGVITEDVLVNYDFGSYVPPTPPVARVLRLTGTGNADPVLELSGAIIPPLVDFGQTSVGSTGEALVTIRNIGLGTLTGSFSGAFPAPFGCAASTCDPFSISAGNAIVVRLTFSPTQDIAYNSSMTLNTNGGNITLNLRGTGRAQPELTVSTAAINFDTLTDPASQTDVGDVRGTTFRVTNTGQGTMSGTVSLTYATPHFLLPTQNISLTSGESTDIQVQFGPIQDTITLSGEVTINANDGVADGWTDRKTIALSGTGAFKPLTDFRGDQPSFGPVVFGRDKTLVLTIKNSGVRPIGQGTFDFPADSAFQCISPIGPSGECEYDIGPNGEQTFSVKFTPKGIGPTSAQMSFSSLPGYTLLFTGTGMPPRFNYKEQ